MLTLKIIGTLWDVAEDCPSAFKFEGPTTKVFEGEIIEHSRFAPQSSNERGDWLLEDDKDALRRSYGFQGWKKGRAVIFEVTLNGKERRISCFGEFDAYIMNERGATIDTIINRVA